MDTQVENAIEIAWNPASDQNLKSQAFEFLNQLRTEPQGWQVCFSLAIREPRPSDIVRHSALEIVNGAINGGQLNAPGLAYLRDNLVAYLHTTYGGTHTDQKGDTPAIQNKMTQTITYLFAALYASGWESFFDDLLSLTSKDNSSIRDNPPGIIFYLRVLNSIHDEIADVLVPRSPEEQRKDNTLKDLVRERDVVKIASSWQDILVEWQSRNDTILQLVLTVVGRWVNWIDISLIINDSLLGLLFGLVSQPKAPAEDVRLDNLRHAAISTFTDIIGKKMKAEDKLELITVLKLSNVISELISSSALQELRSTSNYDTDLAEAVAKLVNNTACDIIKVLDTDTASTDQVKRQANDSLQIFLPYVLRFFSDEYDEICSTVIPVLTDLLTFFRKESKNKGILAPQYTAMLSPILSAIIAKMKYDDTSTWGNEDAQTDEAEFQELRKRLQVLQQAVAVVDEPMYIESITNVVGTTFERLHSQRGQLDWRDVDLAMHEMFLFGELAVKNGGLYSKTKPVSAAAERLIDMMFKLVESDVASLTHPAIKLQYMEICVRYSTFFEANPRLITRVLENFVAFVHHDHIKVRTRSWYLFHRFVKHVRLHIGNIAETVIQALGDLLPIKAELSEATSDDDDMSSDTNEQSTDAAFNSQLYLYEAVGCICGAHAVPVDNQGIYIQSVLTPLFSDLEAHLGPAKNGDERAVLQVHHLIMALGTLARGFSDWTPASSTTSAPPPAKAVSEEFTRAAEAIIVALETLNSSFEIRTAARFAFSRLISVLGVHILPQLPRWIDGLLSRTSTKDEMALFLRLLDQIVYEFKTEIFDILDTLLTPLLQRVFTGIAEPTAGTDDEIQLAELKREYLGFLLVILNNDLGSVLVSNTNQPTFDTVISTIEHFAKDLSDFPTAKLAFSVLIKLTSTWGGPDIVHDVSSKAGNAIPPASSPQPTLAGFDRFMMTRFSPLCWTLPMNPNFNPKDAQGKQVLGEAAGLQKAIYVKTGHDYMTWLREVELKGMGIDGNTIEEYVGALVTLDAKGFRQFFQTFVQRSGR
ncbi:trna exportin [Lasallia pustulata]|uniref:Exportin-T n=1 Tax=Lasallia pustulata TaxID=136370 RepID=A0A1W5CUK8_9LECA|nr:trna exportin [Lasallia pustulata]